MRYNVFNKMVGWKKVSRIFVQAIFSIPFYRKMVIKNGSEYFAAKNMKRGMLCLMTV